MPPDQQVGDGQLVAHEHSAQRKVRVDVGARRWEAGAGRQCGQEVNPLVHLCGLQRPLAV